MDLLLDVEAAAVEAGVGASTIRRWIAEGSLHPETRRPTRVWASEVGAVRDAKHAAQRAPLTKPRRLNNDSC